MPIRKLSPVLVNQIAAGEVIERPASVVKELLENALDAGAQRIDIQVEAGGIELIRTADDGGGINADDLPLAVEAHATSKIAEADDLVAIRSLGFRGEALASIAAVSRLKLTSRTAQAESGHCIEAAGDQHSDMRPAACAAGTIVEVRNLFFNTPARRKFLRTAATEFGHISEMTSRIAMAQPDVGFALMHQQRSVLDLPPRQSPRNRCLAVLGDELAEALIEFDSNERGVELWGLAGQPAIARTTARYQYVYLNGRPIRDRHISHAIKEAYRGLIEPMRHPLVVLFITVDPAAVDVNVHPTKAEVRFRNGNLIHGQVLAAIRQCLLGSDLTPAVDLSARPSLDLRALRGDESAAAQRFDWNTAPRHGAPPPVTGAPTEPDESQSDETDSKLAGVRAFVDYFRRMDPTQKGFIYEQVRREMADPDDDGQPADASEATPTGPIGTSHQSILQIHNAYVVTQDEHGIVIIDQHALHERMMFEKLYDRICARGQLESQRLLAPVTIQTSAAQLNLLEKLHPLLEKIGIEAEPMGPGTVGIHAFPTLLFDRHVEPGEFVQSLLERAEETDFRPSDEAALHEVLDMMSCKAAVKAGDTLQPDELTELLKRRDQVERVSNCPHGRPTTIRLSLDDLAKHFKRT